MKINKILLTFVFVVLMTVTALAAVPYKSLYYDGADHAYTADKIYLNINGTTLDDSSLPLQPINIDGSRTLVPLREVFENLGATVNFDSATNVVTVKDGSNTVILTVGSKNAMLNGQTVMMDVEPKFVALSSTSPKKVMIPLRFVSESLGYNVNYDASTRIIYLKKDTSTSGNSNTNTSTETTTTVKLTEKNSTTVTESNQATAKITGATLPTSTNKSLKLVSDTPITDISKSTLADGRLVVDIENATLGINPIDQKVSVDKLTNVKVAQFATNPIKITRAVLSFSGDTTYTVILSNDRKTLTIGFSDFTPEKDTTTVPSNNNATKVVFNTDGVADVFVVYGDGKAPVIEGVTSVDATTMNIDIARPNTILDGATSDTISSNTNSVAVKSYKISNVDSDTTRIQLTLNSDCIYSVVENGTLTKVYVKPKTIATNSGDVLTLTQTNNTAVLKINKDKAGIPLGFNINSIVHTDKYMSDLYYLNLPLSMKDVLVTPKNLAVGNDILKSIDILNENNATKFVFNGKKVLHVKVTEDGDNIIITVKAARDVYDTIIVVDPGHGGKDPGTSGKLNGTTYYEKNVVLDIGTKATKYISQDTRFKVYMTRTDDTFIELYDRPAFSTHLGADMFISIHSNASSSAIPSGIDTFYFDVQKEDATYLNSKGVYVTDYRKNVTAKSKAFSQAIQKNLISATSATDRGFKHGDYAVLRQNEIPSILIETGFMSNQADLAKLADDSYRTKIARTIADTVIAYYGSY